MRKIVIGWFVDWDGLIRRSESPGTSYKAFMAGPNSLSIEDDSGYKIFQATYYKTLEELEEVLLSAGVTPKFA